MATHPALTAGTRLGAYEVLEQLGAGGMGEKLFVVKPEMLPNVLPPQLVIVQHFDSELRRLAPPN